MKRWMSTLVAAAALVMSQQLPATPQAMSGWAFLQKSEQAGTWRVYLSQQGLQAVNNEMGVTLVTKAPQWNLAVYNTKTKVYCLSTVKDWQVHFQRDPKYRNRAKFVSKQAARKGTTSVIAGMRATQYFVDALVRGDARQAEVWLASDVHIPSELSQLFEKMYDFPLGNLGSMPLRFSYIDESGKKTMVINTLQGRPETIQTASFNYPTHFKRVDSQIAVLVDEKDRKTMAGILDDLDDPDSQQELNSLLGKSGTKRTQYRTSQTPSYSSSQYSSNQYRYGRPGSSTTTAVARTTPQPKPAQQQNNDWLGNVFKQFGGK
jgi:hypothetical protein